MIEKFFAWIEAVTGLTYKKYKVGNYEFGVQWPIVAFVVFIWIAMFVFLP